MKQVTIAIVAIIALLSFVPEKKYKVELSLEQWNAIISELDNSTAPHNDVKITTNWLVEQIRPQLDTLKKSK